MHKFDKKSMRMRYPISKSLKKNNDNLRLDFHNFHNRMTEFYNAIMQIDGDISGQVNYEFSESNFDMFMEKYQNSKPSLIRFIDFLKPYVREKKTTFDDVFDIKDFSCEILLIEKHKLQKEFLKKLSCDNKVLIETLYYAGRDIKTKRIRLPLSQKESIKDFVNFCLHNMKTEYEVEFGVEPTYLNAITKDESYIIECIQISMDILDKNK